MPLTAPRVLLIGCSTGGPQALNAIIAKIGGVLERAPVLITQHMPATFTAILAEHLERLAGRPAREAREGEEINAGTIYVAPGGRHMTVKRGDNGAAVVALDDGPLVNFCKPSVDPMFASAAQVWGYKVMALVLTGMGTDGLNGAKAIVAAGGNVMAQDEATSVVWGMPGQVAHAALMLGRAAAFRNRAAADPRLRRGAHMSPEDFGYLRKLLKERSGLVLAAEKQYLAESRLLPLARKNGMTTLTELIGRLKAPTSAVLVGEVVDAMTTNETFFFRDKIPFEHFRDTIMPALIAERAREKRIRIWCTAASTGQEPYSLAMTIKAMGAALAGYKVQILATDICAAVLEKAKAGIYSQFEVQRGLPIQQLVKFFTQVGECWQIAPEIRAMVQFRTLNLLNDFSPLGTFDIVFCRNVLIYFDQPTKIGVLERVARQIAADGFLVLGAAETVVGLTDTFKPVADKRGLYAPTGAARAAIGNAMKVAAKG